MAPVTTDSIVRNAIPPGIADIFLMPRGGGDMWRGGLPYRGQRPTFPFFQPPDFPALHPLRAEVFYSHCKPCVWKRRDCHRRLVS